MQDNILICDSNPDTVDILKNRLLSENRNIYTTESGLDALDMIREGKVNIVITDLILRQVDGLKVLECAKKESPDTRVIVLSDNHPGELVRKINSLGADYVILKDNFEIISERVDFLSEKNIRKSHKTVFHEHVITEFLMKAGFRYSHKGFRLTVDAIRLCLHDSRYRNAVTKMLYPELSQIHSMKSKCIEKSMRDAISFAWNSDRNLIHEYFREKPTNRDFIIKVSEVIESSENKLNIAE